jgi:hypothetical protein
MIGKATVHGCGVAQITFIPSVHAAVAAYHARFGTT